MAKVPVVLSLLLFVVVGICQASNVVKMSAEHSSLLEKFHPVVKRFAVGLTKAIGDIDNLQGEIYDVITKDIAAQVDKLVLLTNGTNFINMCCKCTSCSRSCSACGKTCCCKGSGGCHCVSCATTMVESMSIDEIDGTMTSAKQMWVMSTRDILSRDLRSLVAKHSSSANDGCCQCQTCFEHCRGCGQTCCARGQYCSCRFCQTHGQTFSADQVDNLVALKPEAESAIKEVGSLVDSLLLLLTV